MTPITRDHHPSRARRRFAAVAALALLSSVAVLGVTAGSAGANSPAHLLPIHGTFTDPGATISDVTPVGALFRFTLTGGTHWQSDLLGDTTYTGPSVIDPATGESGGVLHEHFVGSLAGVGSGTLDFVDWIETHADGSGETDCFVVGGGSALAGIRGFLRFVWTATAPDGSAQGTMNGFLVL